MTCLQTVLESVRNRPEIGNFRGRSVALTKLLAFVTFRNIACFLQHRGIIHETESQT